MVVFSSIALPLDDPETSYNESETLMDSAAIVAINIAADANPLVQITDTITAERAKRAAWDKSSMRFARTERNEIVDSNLRLKLLCTLNC